MTRTEMTAGMLKNYQTLDLETLACVEGGRNNWQTNVMEGSGAALAGWGVGTAVCAATGVGATLAPVCGYTGAKLGVSIWAGVTGATGGF